MRRHLVPFLLALSLFGVVLGLKLDVVHRFGTDLPMWDQWDAEGMTVYVPWSQNRLTLEHIFRPHNEHRVALTRLLGMAEVALNGQWDARLQCVVNAVLHAAFAVALFAFARRLLGPGWSAASFVLIGALVGLPLAWQNVISAFHSQQYFLLLLSFGAIALLPTSPAWSARWWIGFASGLLALFSMASGFLAAIAAAAVVAVEAWRGPRLWRDQWPTLAACALLTGLGVLLHVHYEGHDPLRAQSLSDFLNFNLHSLQWPLESAWAAALLWAPLVALALLLVRRHPPRELPEASVLFALGGWTFAQIVASAYARGVGGGFPVSRYMDTLAFGLVVNGLAAFFLLSRATGKLRFLALAAVLAWSAAAGVGVHRLARSNYANDLPAVRDYHARCEQNVRAYLATGDPSQLRGDDFPYPNANNFRERIDQPALRALMPASVRPPLRLETARGAAVLRPVPAGTTPEIQTRSWTSRGGQPGTWESLVIDFPHSTTLRFRLHGPIGSEGTLLEWRDTRIGATLADVIAASGGPAAPVGTVRVPAGPARLMARLDDPHRQLTFEEPVEVARFSQLAAQIAGLGSWFAVLGAVAGAASLALERWPRRR